MLVMLMMLVLWAALEAASSIVDAHDALFVALFRLQPALLMPMMLVWCPHLRLQAALLLQESYLLQSPRQAPKVPPLAGPRIVPTLKPEVLLPKARPPLRLTPAILYR